MRTSTVLLPVILVAGVGCSRNHQPTAPEVNKDVIAVVLGRQIRSEERNHATEIIWKALFGQFAKDNHIEPTVEELDTFIVRRRELDKQLQLRWEGDRRRLIQDLKDPTLSMPEREKKQSRLESTERFLETFRETNERPKGTEEHTLPVEREMAQHFVQKWKFEKTLYDKYGGRLIYQKFGVEPLDAYREFLEEQQRNGAFEIFDKQCEVEFWSYFTDGECHRFYSGDDGAEFINTPWWLMDLPQE